MYSLALMSPRTRWKWRRREPQGERMNFAQTEDGLSLMADFIQSFTPCWSFWRATGGLERGSGGHPGGQGLPVVVVNPYAGARFLPIQGDPGQNRQTRCPGDRPVRPSDPARGQAFEDGRSAGIGGDPEPAAADRPNAPRRRRTGLHSAPGWTKKDIRLHITGWRNVWRRSRKELSGMIRKSPVWRVKDELLRSFKG